MTSFNGSEWTFPYTSQRMPVLAENVASTEQPPATQAALRALAAGGNAVDAAIAAGITLTVVAPCMNGIGGDVFAIVWDGRQLHRSEEHTSELQSLMRISYAVFCLKKKNTNTTTLPSHT